ncbi:MAG TPA: biopolymer transporter ExbD [Acidobacteriota bacterium]|nr:biopolymer transporter ExbD [Acidobacteriota bacterium]
MNLKAQINITPYIDILLVLLIIFMVLQPVSRHQLESRPVEEASTPAAAPQAVIVLSVDEQLNLSLNGEEIPFNRLGSRLFDVFSGRSDKRLYLAGDPALPFGDVVRLVDVAKASGAGDIGFLELKSGS